MNELAQAVPSAAITNDEFIQRRKDFLGYVKNCMIEKIDFGKIEGIDKPSLYKPGAEKMCTLYGFTSRMILTEKEEVWDQDKPFFKYDYKAQIIWPRKMPDGTIREELMAECEGTCNSMESKYGYRWLPYAQLSEYQRKKADAGELKSDGRDMEKPLFVIEKEDAELYKKIIVENTDKPGTWKVFNRDSKKIDPKTSKPYPVAWVLIPAVKQYQVINDRIFDQVNTLKKMSQKRAFVGAVLIATGASEVFTQDVEDIQGFKEVEVLGPEDEKGKDAKNVTQTTAKPTTAKPATEKKETVVQEQAGEFDLGKFRTEMDKCVDLKGVNDIIKKIPEKFRSQEVMEYYGVTVKNIKDKEKVATNA